MTHEFRNSSEQGLPQEVQKLTATLIKDFRNSYKYSQGNPDLQRILMTLLRDHYAQTQTNTLSEISSALLTVSSHVGRFALPPQHKKTNANVTEDFTNSFTEFSRCLTQPEHMPTRSVYENGQLSDQPFPADRQGRLNIMLSMTAAQDDLYLEGRHSLKGRPRTSPDADPYESYFRTYILGGADTHSDAYNTMFSDARHLLIAAHPQTGFEWMEGVWESHHPGEEYYPQPYLAEVQAYRSE